MMEEVILWVKVRSMVRGTSMTEVKFIDQGVNLIIDIEQIHATAIGKDIYIFNLILMGKIIIIKLLNFQIFLFLLHLFLNLYDQHIFLPNRGGKRPSIVTILVKKPN